MVQGRDAIDYFRGRTTPAALAALALFDAGGRQAAYNAIISGQDKAGSWKDSLAETIRHLDLLARLGFDVSDAHVAEAVEWILWQQGLHNSYLGAFASPTDSEMAKPFALPTGEKLNSRASFVHICGELALKALLDVGARDDPRLKAMLGAFETIVRKSSHGMYCCRTCSTAFWQVASMFPQFRMRVAEGLKTLKNYRTASGAWRGFPFYFTLQTLGQIKGLEALEEFEFALGRLARACNRDGSWGRTSSDEKTLAVVSAVKALRVGEV